MSPPTSSQPSPSGMNSHQSLSRFPAALRSSNGHTAVTSIFEDQETPLGVGLGCQLPRRNHTISSGTSRASTRRLAEHFEQPLHPASPVSTLNGRDALSASGPSSSIFRHHNPASPSKNSLQDILQMEDPAHEVEWEQAIQNERQSADEQLAALSTQSGSNATASSSIRRHQSLNYHGTRVANRIPSSFNPSDLSPQRNHHTMGRGPTSSPSITTPLQNAFVSGDSARTSTLTGVMQLGGQSQSGSNVSPVSPSRFSQSAWSIGAGTEDNTEMALRRGSPSPSRFAHTFLSPTNAGTEGSSPKSNRQVGAERNVHLSRDLMDIHASLQKMDIQDGRRQDQSVNAAEHNISSTSHFSNKNLPTLNTNSEAVGEWSRHGRTNSSAELALGGPGSDALSSRHSHSPSLSYGHSRVQSTDGVLYSHRGMTQGSCSSSPPSLAGIFGPHTAAPISQWVAKEDILGPRPQAGLGGSQMSPPFASRPNAHTSPYIQKRADASPPSQWGLALSPKFDNGVREQNMLRLSMALAEKRQEAAALEAMLRAGGQIPQPDPYHPYLGSPPSSWQPPSPMMISGPVPHFNLHAGAPPAGVSIPSTMENGLASAEVRSLSERLGLNPVTFELLPPASARFLVIKSFTEDDVHRSIRHRIWASTDKGNQRLNRVYLQCQKEAEERGDRPTVYLFFSVNGSGHFCGLAEMTSAVDFNTSSDVWAQEGKWKGTFQVRHIFVKDVPNRELRHIKLPNNPENKSVTQSRDTQELNREAGIEMLRIMYAFPARTSLLQGLILQSTSTGQGQLIAGSTGKLEGTTMVAHSDSYVRAEQPHFHQDENGRGRGVQNIGFRGTTGTQGVVPSSP